MKNDEAVRYELDPSQLQQALQMERLLTAFFQLLDDVQGCRHRERVTELRWHPTEPASTRVMHDCFESERVCHTCGLAERAPYDKLAKIKRVVEL